MKNKERYFKCWKCGALAVTYDDKKPIAGCVQPFPNRTSGICGGSFTIEISKEEFFELRKKINEKILKNIK